MYSAFNLKYIVGINLHNYTLRLVFNLNSLFKCYVFILKLIQNNR